MGSWLSPESRPRQGLGTGGVNGSGGRGRGRTEPGAGRISIGGGSGATCWLTTGGGSEPDSAGKNCGRGATILGFGKARRGFGPGSAVFDPGRFDVGMSGGDASD